MVGSLPSCRRRMLDLMLLARLHSAASPQGGHVRGRARSSGGGGAGACTVMPSTSFGTYFESTKMLSNTPPDACCSKCAADDHCNSWTVVDFGAPPLPSPSGVCHFKAATFAEQQKHKHEAGDKGWACPVGCERTTDARFTSGYLDDPHDDSQGVSGAIGSIGMVFGGWYLVTGIIGAILLCECHEMRVSTERESNNHTTRPPRSPAFVLSTVLKRVSHTLHYFIHVMLARLAWLLAISDVGVGGAGSRARGQGWVPHPEFWQSIRGLVVDGVRFCASGGGIRGPEMTTSARLLDEPAPAATAAAIMGACVK